MISAAHWRAVGLLAGLASCYHGAAGADTYTVNLPYRLALVGSGSASIVLVAGGGIAACELGAR